MKTDELGLLMKDYDSAGANVLTTKVAIKVLGKKRFFNGVVSRIKNCECNVALGFKGGIEELEEDDYIDLFMPEHRLEVPKSVMTDHAYEFILKRFLVTEMIVTESSYFFYILADEGNFCNEVEEIISNINDVLVPFINKSLASVKIYNFKVTFLISKFY